jgi:hypothetical protein
MKQPQRQKPGQILSIALVFLSSVVLSGAGPLPEGVLFASANLGETGQNGGRVVDDQQFLGVRFHLTGEATIGAVGGHFSFVGGCQAFILRLPNHAALPAPPPFPADQVVASTECVTDTLSSRDYVFPLRATLPAGHYALIFANGHTTMPSNDVEIRNADELLWNGTEWLDIGSLGKTTVARMVIYGGPSDP